MRTVGIDEVGRGCWAGPVVAGAVVLPEDFIHNGKWKLADSKLLSRKQREMADMEIRKIALSIGLGWVDAAELDSIGLTSAVALAMRRALSQIKNYDEVIIDGQINFLQELPKTRALIKADALIPAASAASIVAKVARDNFMTEAAERYPEYGFDRHVGYGTALHLEKMKLHGLTPLHRHSFKPVKAVII